MSIPVVELNRLKSVYREQLALCDCLETIADSLPCTVDRVQCIGAARALGPLISRANGLEEDFLFPALASVDHIGIDMAATLERLKFEHLENECFAEELHDALMAYGSGRDTPHPDAFGYMLRGFFESLRRHIALEDEIVLPLLKDHTFNRSGPQGTSGQE